MGDKYKFLLYFFGIIMIVAFFIILLTYQTFAPTSDRKLNNLFQKHEQSLSLVAMKLEEIGYQSININKFEFEDNMYVQNQNVNYVGETIKINDSKLLNDLQKLFDSNFEIIRKDNGIIYFQVYSNRDIGKGILYSYNEINLKEIDTLIKLVPIDDKWFIYEEN